MSSQCVAAIFCAVFCPGQQLLLPQLIRWSYRFSPLIELDQEPAWGPGDPRFVGINLDLTGSIKLFHSTENLLQQISSGLTALKVQHRICFAPTLGAAWALSRYAPQPLLIAPSLRQELKAVLSPLPITALRVSHDLKTALQEVAVRHIGELFSLSRGSLLSRFGKELLRQLDYLLGDLTEPLTVVHQPQILRRKKTLFTPVDQREAIEVITKQLLHELFTTLEARHQKISVLTLELKPVAQSTLLQQITLSMPSVSLKHIWSLLQGRLAQLKLSSALEAIGLAATQVENIASHNLSYLSSTTSTALTAQRANCELLDRLKSLLGPAAVRAIQLRESHLPESSIAFYPITALRGQQQPARILRAERPSLLFAKPQKIATMSLLPDGIPHRLYWCDQIYPITTGFGPERIALPWWEHSQEITTQHVRDYFRVELEFGLWLWVFRELNTAQWYVHGVWS